MTPEELSRVKQMEWAQDDLRARLALKLVSEIKSDVGIVKTGAVAALEHLLTALGRVP